MAAQAWLLSSSCPAFFFLVPDTTGFSFSLYLYSFFWGFYISFINDGIAGWNLGLLSLPLFITLKIFPFLPVMANSALYCAMMTSCPKLNSKVSM